MSDQDPEREDSEAGTYDDLQREVDKHFDGKWENFLKAVRNPAEILYFVLWNQCDGQAPKIEAWAKDQGLPADWLPRFYGMLTARGEFRPDAVTVAPEAPEASEGDAAVQASADAAVKASLDGEGGAS
ncbi:MAG: hypothetical protein KDK70_29385 [Myxococcales bacterium]|nr:hypothetical protein [Myxococcales bacterium]